MANRKIKDAKDLVSGELIYFRNHAKATYMSNGMSVEDAINNINFNGGDSGSGSDMSGYYTKEQIDSKGYLTEIPSEYLTENELEGRGYATTTQVDAKQDIISDLNVIRSGATAGATALQAVPAEYVTEDKLSNKGFATTTYVDEKVADLVNGAPETLDTLDELAAALKDNKDIVDILNNSIGVKQDKIDDLDNIRTNASKGATALQSVPAEYVTETELNAKGYLTSHQDISGKQDTLTSGTNIKTINGISVLGSGNMVVGHKTLQTTTSTSMTLTPNVYHRNTSTTLSSLTITLGSISDNTILNEYFVEFTTRSSGTTVNLPSGIKWANGETPTFEASTTYQISIINNLGVVAKFK